MNKQQLTDEFMRQGEIVDSRYRQHQPGIDNQVNRLYEHVRLTNWAIGRLLSMLPDDAQSKEDEDS